MKKILESNIVSTGLAIFSMLFGAGNLMYPLAVGMTSGNKNFFGIAGFFVTAVFLPVTGFISMMLFNGNYNTFFNRLGKPVGRLLILLCMLIIGPLVVIPRITTLSHTMIAPFLPLGCLSVINPTSSLLFSIIFLGITFLLTWKENSIVDVLGYIISPALLVALTIIIIKGIIMGGVSQPNILSDFTIFKKNMIKGYETLDLLGAIFFSSIVLSILKTKMGKSIEHNPHRLAIIGFKAGLIGVSLLGIIYIGMSVLGVYHGLGLEHVNDGELFRIISFRILGGHGSAIIATAVLMACLSTSIALNAVVAEYVQSEVCNQKISYTTALVLVILSCIPLSVAGLSYVLELTGGIITYVGYPVLITITFANIAYKLFNIKTIKLPVFATFLIALVSYYYDQINTIFSICFS